jgi:hypothetical protein
VEWLSVREQLLEFDEKHNPDFYIAYEKNSCDRNRWRATIGSENFNRIAHKFVDFQRIFVNPITTLSLNSGTQIYLPGRELSTLYEFLFLDSGMNVSVSHSFSPYVLTLFHTDVGLFFSTKRERIGKTSEMSIGCLPVSKSVFCVEGNNVDGSRLDIDEHWYAKNLIKKCPKSCF